MKFFIKGFVISILITVCSFGQTNRIGFGAYVASGFSIKADYSHDIFQSFFIAPGYCLSITKDGKSIFSWESYLIDAGYYALEFNNSKIYTTAGISYNNFLRQSREGNSKLISENPPYSFWGEEKRNCIGIQAGVGALSNLSKVFNVGIEVRYLLMFPKVKYNYSVSTYNYVSEKPVTQRMIFAGVRLVINL